MLSEVELRIIVADNYSGLTTLKQKARTLALEISYLLSRIKIPPRYFLIKENIVGGLKTKKIVV